MFWIRFASRIEPAQTPHTGFFFAKSLRLGSRLWRSIMIPMVLNLVFYVDSPPGMIKASMLDNYASYLTSTPVILLPNIFNYLMWSSKLPWIANTPIFILNCKKSFFVMIFFLSDKIYFRVKAISNYIKILFI